MGLIRPSVVVLALAMTAPALYRGLVTQDLDIVSALLRFLIAVPIAAVMLAGLRLVTSGYGDRAEGTPATLAPAQPTRPDDDTPAQPA